MKVETDIASTSCITEILIERVVIMYVEIFKHDVIVFFIGSVIVFDVTLTDNFQYQSQFIDIENQSVRLKETCLNY